MTDVTELKDCKPPPPGERFSHDDNEFELLGLDHFAIPCRDVELMTRFVIEVLGGVPHYLVGFDEPGPDAPPPPPAWGGVRPKQSFLRVGNVLMQCSPPIDKKMKIGEDDPNPWPHWAFTTTAKGLEDNCERLRKLGIPVFGPALHPSGNEVSAYFATPEGHKLELVTYEPFPKEKTIGIFGPKGVGGPPWHEDTLYYEWSSANGANGASA